MVRMKKKKNIAKKHLIPKGARIWVVLLCGIFLAGFIVIPFFINLNPVSSVEIDASQYANSLEKPAPTFPIIRNAPVAPPILTPQPTSTPNGIATIEIYFPTFKLDDKNPSIHLLQARLMELGYFDYDQTTDTYGTVTESAVLLFQRTNGFAQTGIADNALQELLYSDDASPYRMAPGDRGTDIKSLQRRLNELGYYDEKDNGYYGIATEKAVLDFQAKNKIEETGIIDIDARDLIFSPKARYKVDPTPTPKPTPKATPKPTKKPTPKPTASPKKTQPPENNETPAITNPLQTTVTPPDNTDNPYDITAPEATPQITPTPQSPSYGTGVSAMISAANAQLGKPYVLGDEGPSSYDCSGLIYYCLRQAGVNVGRYTAAAYSEYSSWQAITSLSDCKAGDLIFYKSNTSSRVSHVAIYLGGGKIIHAATSAGKVLIDNTTNYYYNNFVIARRVF